MHSSYFFKAKRGLLKTYLLPLISIFTLVNPELRNISNDKMTAYSLILKELNSHLSFVIYQQYLSFCTEQLLFHFLFLHLFYLTEEVGSKDKVVEEFIF